MNGPHRVRFGERLARLEQVVHRDRDRERTTRREDSSEVGAAEVLHHEVGRTDGRFADVDHPPDVLAPDLDRGAPFAEEPRHVLWILGDGREQQLDRHALLEMDVRRCEDDAHTAEAEHALDAILLREDLPDARDPRGELLRRG